MLTITDNIKVCQNLKHAFHFLESDLGHQILNSTMKSVHVGFSKEFNQVIALPLKGKRRHASVCNSTLSYMNIVHWWYTYSSTHGMPLPRQTSDFVGTVGSFCFLDNRPNKKH